MFICPKCQKSRAARETIVHKDGKAWLIESCPQCNYHFDITEWNKGVVRNDSPKRKASWFKSRIRRDPDEGR